MSIEDEYFVDSGKTYEGASTSTITGLTNLVGETVKILADGEVQEDKVVNESGEVTLDTAASKVQIGLAYTSKLEPLKPVINTQMGTSAASIVSCREMGISFHDSAEVQYGTSDARLFDIDFTDARWENDSSEEGLFTGMVKVSVDGGFDLDNPLIISTDAPLPCTVRAIIPAINVTGR